MNFKLIDKSDIPQPKKSDKYAELRNAIKSLRGSQALFVTGLRRSEIQYGVFPMNVSIKKCCVEGENGYAITKQRKPRKTETE